MKKQSLETIGEFKTSGHTTVRVFAYLHKHRSIFSDETLFVIMSNGYIRYGNRTQTHSIINTYHPLHNDAQSVQQYQHLLRVLKK